MPKGSLPRAMIALLSVDSHLLWDSQGLSVYRPEVIRAEFSGGLPFSVKPARCFCSFFACSAWQLVSREALPDTRLGHKRYAHVFSEDYQGRQTQNDARMEDTRFYSVHRQLAELIDIQRFLFLGRSEML